MDIRYPIGTFKWPGRITEKDRRKLIDQVEEAPKGLRAAVRGLTDEQLNTPYRDGAWMDHRRVY